MGSERDSETVTIDGNEWSLADIQAEIAACRGSDWRMERWKPSAALVHKNGGRVSLYTGQQYDPEKIELVEHGWSHDHCEICWFALRDSDKDEENTGWTDGEHAWLCLECHEKFIAAKN